MILRSGRTKNKMANVRQIEPEQENLYLEEARELPNPEINLVGLPTGQSVTQSSTGAIPKIINHSAGRGRGFRQTNVETSQNRKTVPNTPNQSFLWDGTDLLFPDTLKLTNPQPDNETIPMDSFLENNNRFLSEASELLKHYDEQVTREREKFIREMERKCRYEDLNKTTRPAAHSSWEKEPETKEKSENRKAANKQTINLKNKRRCIHQSSDTDNSEPLEFEGNFNQSITRRTTIRNRPARRSRADQCNQITEDNSEVSDNDNDHPRPTMHFSFGMTQTPFQVMSNWPLKFRNNKEDSPAHFLDDLKRFKRGYQISSRDILENMDALLTKNAKD